MKNLRERTEKQLERVENAIAAIESGAQSYMIEENGMRRELRRGDLEALYKREKALILRLNRLSGRSTSRTIPAMD